MKHQLSRKARIQKPRATSHLLDLLQVEGLSGREAEIAAVIREKLYQAGAKRSWMIHDKAHESIGQDFEIGNLIVRVPGTAGRRKEPTRLFVGHMDTVPLCRGAQPVKRGRRIVARGATALGGDNRTAVAALIALFETLKLNALPHPPLTLLFTVGEEVGLRGARAVDPAVLGNAAIGFNVDGGDPAEITIGAIGADRWEARVHGRSSHAGVHPEDGISATLIAARAIADVAAAGYFGKVALKNKMGTSNVGSIHGGEASNQVTDYVLVEGECRSHDRAFLKRITNAYARAFERAAKSVKNASGACGQVDFNSQRDYDAFKIKESAAPVQLAKNAADSLGLEPQLKIANGGLDANYLNAKGIPTVTLGAGQHHIHTVDEYVDLDEFHTGCQLLVAIATA